MRLKVTVGKATVAKAWKAATTDITTIEDTRDWAIFQNPSVPNGMGLSKVILATTRLMATTISAIRQMSQRRRCLASTYVVVDVAVTGAVLTTAPPSHDQIDKYRSAQHPEDHRNWDFKRHDNGPANDIGQGYHHNAYHYHP